MSLKISIAVPSYNYGIYLEECLLSILNQSYPNYEVLIADAGSNDSSLQIINRFVSLDHRFKLVSTTDSGQANAINKAFSCATGDIYCYLNADDLYISKEALAMVSASFLEFDPMDMLLLSGAYVSSSGRYTSTINYRRHPLDSFENFLWRPAVVQPSSFWRRELTESYSFDESLHYAFDSDFYLKHYCDSSVKWIELPILVSGYRIHGGNKSCSVSPMRVREISVIKRRYHGAASLSYICSLFNYCLVQLLLLFPFVGAMLANAARLLVNSISFVTFYRIPGI